MRIGSLAQGMGPAPERRSFTLLFACCMVGLGVPLGLGMGYGPRLSSAEGFYLVPVTEAEPAPAPVRPRRAVLVVLDGLGREEAGEMRALARMRARGQCRVTDVGAVSVSRPLYAVLSTGLEADRTGVRGNNDTPPLAAESVWEVAREAGLSVAAVSELAWWRELFPRAFNEYVLADRAVDVFRFPGADGLPAADLQLIHPLYIDEAGHDAGAGSAAYRAAVARADGELEGLIGRMDLARDLLIVTADHGHSLRGGHGGRQPRIAEVLSCFAGVGVRHVAAPGPLRATTIAPALALLLGLRFPAHMRAGDDDLDALWEIADSAAFPGGYLEARRRDVERFRRANHAQLLRWMPASAGSWDRFYAERRRLQVYAAAPLLGLVVVVLALHGRAHRRGERGDGLFGLAFVIGFFVVAFGLQVGVRGSFDLSSIAHREEFIAFTVALGLLWGAGAAGLHLLARRRVGALLLDLGAVSLVGTLLCVAHPVALGWRVGFPMPPPPLYFFPYFSALLLAAVNGVGLLVCGLGWWRTRGR